MKTSKSKTVIKPKKRVSGVTKTVSKPKKAPGVTKTVKSKKATARKSVLNEEDIRKKANEIYMERIARGEHGTSLDDWHKAEEILKKK